jgi:thioredoxin reductase (NADPH)
MAHHSTGQATAVQTDALVIGAGPVGLFQVFELGLLGISAQVVDSLPQAGGQCMALYADKPIYDIPGIARCTGRELTERLLAQIAPFKPAMHLGHIVNHLQRKPDGGFSIRTEQGLQWECKAVFIAAGVGAFSPKKLKLDGALAITVNPVQYQVQYPVDSSRPYAGQHVIILGDSEEALSSALALSQSTPAPASVSVLYRRDVFTAGPATIEQFRNAIRQGSIALHLGQATALKVENGRLIALQLMSNDGSELQLPCDALLSLQGLSPQLGPLADWGLAMERKQIQVDTEKFETSEPGIYAVGDINHYAGKQKLILCGFHEATLAAFAAAVRIRPQDNHALQYTTSSSLLQQRLGVR